MKIFNEITDTVTSMSFSRDGAIIALTSWDCCVYFYNTRSNELIDKIRLDTPPLCSTCYFDKFFVGCCDGKILKIYPRSQPITVYTRNGMICDMCNTNRGIAVASADQILTHFQDNGKIISEWKLSKRPFKIASFSSIVTVACACRYIVIYDMDIENKPKQRYESPLRHQTRAIHMISPDKIVIGSVEGRIAILPLNSNPVSFNAHVVYRFDGRNSYPVNSIISKDSYILTGGSDGNLNIYEPQVMKIIRNFQGENSINVIGLNGDTLYIATGYGWEHGPKDIVKPECFSIDLKII